MDRSLTRDEVRSVDRIAIDEFGLPGAVLMENAGRGATALLMSLGIDGPIVICCGKGNNGGDGFVIARHLENLGFDVLVVLFADPEWLRGDAAINWNVIDKAGMRCVVCADGRPTDAVSEHFRRAAWIVDALLGTGTRGEVGEPYRSIINAMNASPAQVLAVDLPSGLDCDKGVPLGIAVQAEHTATFVARKAGFDAPEASAWTGTVHVIDIGVPQALLDRFVGDS